MSQMNDIVYRLRHAVVTEPTMPSEGYPTNLGGQAADRIEALEAEKLELEQSFDLRWKADMRGIKRWQNATGRELVWPDHADLIVWLLERIEALEQPE